MHNEPGLEAVWQTILPGPEPGVEDVGLVQSDNCAVSKVQLAGFVHNLPKLTPCLEEMAKVDWKQGRLNGVLEPHLAVPLGIPQRIWQSRSGATRK